MTQTATTSDQDQSHSATPSTASKANDSGRCIFRYSNHSRCRLQVFNHSTGLCLLHARSKDLQPEDTDDLSAELFEDLPDDQLPALQTPEQINDFLARVVVLLAEGRITPRRATVFTYAGSLLLRSAIVIDQNTFPQITFDAPRPDRSYNNEPSQPEEPSPVLGGAAR